jgi:hypothetical protein
MDGFLAQPDPQSVVAGPVAAATKALADARANHAAFKRSETLSTIGRSAERRAASANSGQNLDNSIRSRIASALERPKVSGGYDAAERAALEGVAEGANVANASRYVGNLLGGGGGLGAAVTGALGAAAGSTLGPAGIAAGIALPAVGFGAKQLANNMTRGALGKVGAMTRQRSPLYRDMLAQTPMTPISPEQRALVMRLLMQGMSGQAANPVNGSVQIQSPTR